MDFSQLLHFMAAEPRFSDFTAALFTSPSPEVASAGFFSKRAFKDMAETPLVLSTTSAVLVEEVEASSASAAEEAEGGSGAGAGAGAAAATPSDASALAPALLESRGATLEYLSPPK
jgi:hypothetical protein